MRSLLLIASTIIGYTLLRGWPADWHPIIRVCLAVSVLVIAFSLWDRHERPASQTATPTRSPLLLDYLAIGTAILLIECFFLVFLSLAPSRSEKLALALDESLHPEVYQSITEPDSAKKTSSSPSSSGNSRITSNWLFSGPGPRSLNKNDQVIPSNRPELYLFPDSAEDSALLLTTELYLRNFTLATYQDGHWFPKATIPRTLTSTNSTITIPQRKPGPAITYELSHPANSLGQTLAVSIPDFSSISLPSLREIHPATFRLPSSLIKDHNYRYQVTSTPFSFDQIKEDRITPALSPAPEYLTLPDDPSLRQKIQTLAATLGPPSRDSLLKLRKLLHSRYRYSLNLNMPQDADPLDSFLFNTREGYCTHFATATAMLTRALGIPSRIAFGWSGGRYFKSPNLFVFRAREAHAWTEIFLEDLGWVIFETTPPSRQEGASSLADSGESPPIADFITDSEEDHSPELLAPLLKAALWLGLASALILITLLLIRRRSAPISPSSPTQALLPPSPHYLAAFRRACLAHGQPMPLGRTLRRHLSEIQAPHFTQQLLHYHYAVHYGQVPKNKLTEKKILSKLKAWEKSAKRDQPQK